MKRRIAILSIALAVTSAACSETDPLMHGEDAAPRNLPDIVGSYVLNGIDPLNIEYVGHLTVTKTTTSGDYALQWIATESIQEGTGSLSGNQLIVIWQSVDAGGEPVKGTATFTVTVDGELYGAKRVDGYDDEWRETAYRLTEDEL